MSTSKHQHKRETWLSHIKAWKRSGKSQKRYCEENNISLVQFGYWRKKTLISNKAAETVSKTKLLDITNVPTPFKPSTSSIIIKNADIEIKVPSTLPLNQLLPILKLLGFSYV